MKDVRIVVVSWNVERLLERCLRSLPSACEGLDWDVAVIDNASADRSVQVAQLFNEMEPGRVKVIANPDNRGFARACNQGIVGADARFILLLNPDTECPPMSIASLVVLATQRPRAGIIGPKLTYPNGEYQHSVRGYPTFWSQSGILLKLHHLFPFWPSFREYFQNDIDTEKEQTVDQIMGACFLIRAEVIKQIGALDERYFIWFEEVDFCRMAKEKGWDVLYAPEISVFHHGGQSFGQVFSLKKQQMFNDSLLKYFKKWHRGWQSHLLSILSPISLALAWAVEIRQRPEKQWIYWMGMILGLETLSLTTIFLPTQRMIASVGVGIVLLLITLKRPQVGLAIMLLELAIGSKGALLKIPNGWDVDGGMSLRIIMSASFFMGWVANSVGYWFDKRHELGKLAVDRLKKSTPWFALGLLIIWGIIRGIQNGNGPLIADANAWFYLLLVLPVWGISWRYHECVLRHGAQALTAALLWLPIKTLGLLYVFSHGLPNLSKPLYLWVRRTGVGEVTLVSGNLFRIFMQSQVYALAGLLFTSAATMKKTVSQQRVLIWAVSISSIVSLFISLSRSIWIGLFAGGITLMFAIRSEAISNGQFVWREFFKEKSAGVLKILLSAVIALLLLLATVSFPYPKTEVGSLASLFGSRGSTSDPAANSRWNLLPVLISKIKESPILGSGFGATVTYKSQDPRILAKNKDGLYTTYAFEWGWLEHWIKFGILGIPVMIWLIVNLILRIWKTDTEWWVRAGFTASLVGLSALHVFTPYLNHPLGFGFLLASEGWIIASKQKDAYAKGTKPV